MESALDIAAAGVLFAGAAGFVFWRFTRGRRAPSCASDGKTQPPVVLGSRLARGLEAAQKGRRADGARR